MDDQTLRFYESHAEMVAARYRAADRSGRQKQFQETYPAGSRVIDVGSGSGRDVAELLALRFDAYGCEPAEGMRQESLEKFPQLIGRIFPYALPMPEDFDTGGLFDGVLCSAVFMHVPEGERFDAAFSLKRLLRERGRLWISVPGPRRGLNAEDRDDSGRLFKLVHAEYLVLLFERLGFHLLRQWEEEDRCGRPEIRWKTFIFELDSARGRALDRIEGVLNRDRKTATYKLALFRALSEMGTMNAHQAVWISGREVALPLRSIAEKWFRYYWPIFESSEFIPQNNGEHSECAKPVAFRKLQMQIIRAYGNRGGLSQFLIDRASGQLPQELSPLYMKTLRCIEKTIKEGPVVYASGNMFRYEKGRVMVDTGAWREFCQLGHWIEPAVVLRWAEETNRMSNGQVTVAEILNRLVMNPTEERNVGVAREVFDALSNKRCVWSGKPLKGAYAVDHVIPFSLWHCNDLWNLLPADPRENGKKSDKLPERSLLFQQKDVIVFYWEKVRERHERRFDFELAHFTANKPAAGNWQASSFQRLVEAVETTAIQRRTERWRP